MATSLLRLASNSLKNVKRIAPVQSALVRYGSSQKRASYEHTLLNLPETQLTTLKNGLRVASEDHGLPTCTVGLWIDAGSRFEDERTNGTAHFLEHMAFKGTKKRSQVQLEKEVESMGAQMKACASREHTAIYAKCLSKDLEHSVEILADILQNNVYSEEAIERERALILREMQEIESNMEEVVFDYLHATAYQGTALGRSVIGTTESVKSITRKDLTDFVQTHYRAPRIVLVGVGGVQHQRLVDLAGRYFGSLAAKPEGEVPVVAPCRYTGCELRLRDDDMPLAHVAIAVETNGVSEDFIPLQVAANLVGCWDRSHGGHSHNAPRLAGHFAEEQTHCQSYMSFNTGYTDTGLWGAYFVGDRFHLYDTWQRIAEEWKRVATAVTDFEVERAKNLVKTNYMLNHVDGSTPIAQKIGHQVLYYNRRMPAHEINSRIDAVDSAAIMKVMNKFVYDRDPAIAAIGPVEDMKPYNRTRADMYWMRK